MQPAPPATDLVRTWYAGNGYSVTTGNTSAAATTEAGDTNGAVRWACRRATTRGRDHWAVEKQEMLGLIVETGE